MIYSKKDLIFWHEDDRLKDAIGKECYYGNSASKVLDEANGNGITGTLFHVMTGSDKPFAVEEEDDSTLYYFIILRKEPKLVPYDLTLKEDRDVLRGRWIKDKTPAHDIEYMMDRFEDGYFMVYVDDEYKLYGLNGDDLFRGFIFADTGEPIGKESWE